jgi:hypothetical protein
MAESTQVTIKVKTPKEMEEVKVNSDSNISDLKDEIGKKFNKTTDQLCLIFAGKILKDTDTLVQHGIKDGVTVHLVIKTKQVRFQAKNSKASLPAFELKHFCFFKKTGNATENMGTVMIQLDFFAQKKLKTHSRI